MEDRRSIENTECEHTEENRICVSGVHIEWLPKQGTCTFETMPVAMMWVDTTLAGLMSGVQAMVGTERFLLALQGEGRKSVEGDWQVISKFPDFRRGFEAIANIAAVAGWGNWELMTLDQGQRECRFRVKDSWEGRYQKAIGVCWGSGMLAGKMAGYCSKLFETNCWADQTAFIAKGDAYDEFVVKPSSRLIEKEIESLLASDGATRADMAVALRKLEQEIAERKRAEEALRRYELLSGHSRDIILFMRRDNGHILEANAAATKAYGYRRDELLTLTIQDLRASDTQKLTADQMIEADARGILFETVHRRKDGSTFPVEVSSRGATIAGTRTLISLIRDITTRKQADEALRERTFELQRLAETLEQRVQDRTAELEKANERLRHLSSKLLSAQEEERKRVAGEMHDTIGTSLSAVKFKVEDVLQQTGQTAHAAAEPLRTIIPVLQESIDECRRIQMDLRPPLLDDLGILATLSWFCRRYQAIYSGIRIEQEIEIREGEIPDALKIVIYRVTQEGMNNVAKHSRADLVHLSLQKLDDRMQLVLKDNGQGFNLEKARSQETSMRGLGLTSMRERAELSGGSFDVESTEGKGTTIRASWPLNKTG